MKSGDVINIDTDDDVNPFDGIKPTLLSCLPLLLLCLFKFTFQHFNDGLLLVGLNLVALKLNSSLVRQVQLKQLRSLKKCFYLSFLSLISVIFSFWTFGHLDIWKCLYMIPLSSGQYGLGVIWLVIFTDSAIKLLAISLKFIIIPLSPRIVGFYKRGCLFAIVEYLFSGFRYLIPGMQLIPYILSAEDEDSLRELYFNYLAIFVFMLLKLYLSYGEFRKVLGPFHLLNNEPKFGIREKKTVSCDLSQKVVSGDVITFNNRNGSKSYNEEDLLHWMASYGTCPDNGVIHSPLTFGNGQTRMNVNLF